MVLSLVSSTPSWVADKDHVKPDLAQALLFICTFFRKGDLLCFRGIPEGIKGVEPHDCSYVFDEHLETNLAGFLDWCALERRAAFMIPAQMTPGAGDREHVKGLPGILIDFDKKTPAASLEQAEALLGPATVVVHSGGIIEETGALKLHAHWALTQQAEGTGRQQVADIREALALKFDGDTAFKNFAQPIRLPGSIHWKAGPKLVVLRTVRADARYALADISAKLGAGQPAPLNPNTSKDLDPKTSLQPAGFDFNFQADRQRVTANEIRQGVIEPEGTSVVTRWGGFNMVAGSEIARVYRGEQTQEQARDFMVGWAMGHLGESHGRPAKWDEAHAGREFDGLYRSSVAKNGQPSAPVPVLEPGWPHFDRWTADAYRGEPAPLKWLVPDTFPMGSTVLLAGDGAVGKSYIMLDLAMRVAGEPAPQNDMDFNDRSIFGAPVAEHGIAVFMTTEDAYRTVHSRLGKLDPSGARFKNPGRLRAIPMAENGGSRNLFRGRDADTFAPTEAYFSMREALLALGPDLKLIIFDMLGAFAGIDINASPDAGNFVFKMFNMLAAETGAVIIVTHHIAKPKTAIRTWQDMRLAVRGTTSLINGPRVAYGLWVKEDRRADDEVCVVGSIIKENIGATTQNHYYRRMPYGVLRQVQASAAFGERATLLETLESGIAAAAKLGAPFTATGTSGLFANRYRLPEKLHSISKNRIEKMAQELLESKRVVKGTAEGSKDRKWLDIAGGDFDMGHGKLLSGSGLAG